MNTIQNLLHTLIAEKSAARHPLPAQTPAGITKSNSSLFAPDAVKVELGVNNRKNYPGFSGYQAQISSRVKIKMPATEQPIPSMTAVSKDSAETNAETTLKDIAAPKEQVRNQERARTRERVQMMKEPESTESQALSVEGFMAAWNTYDSSYDSDQDGDIDGTDYLNFQKESEPAEIQQLNVEGFKEAWKTYDSAYDSDQDGDIDGTDYLNFQKNMFS